jgi:hypothetical protein
MRKAGAGGGDDRLDRAFLAVFLDDRVKPGHDERKSVMAGLSFVMTGQGRGHPVSSLAALLDGRPRHRTAAPPDAPGCRSSGADP